jgi:hypothetical protein
MTRITTLVRIDHTVDPSKVVADILELPYVIGTEEIPPSTTLIHAHVYLQGHDFSAYGVTHQGAMLRLFHAVQDWFEYAHILNVSRNTVEKLEELADFDEIYSGLATYDQKHV